MSLAFHRFFRRRLRTRALVMVEGRGGAPVGGGATRGEGAGGGGVLDVDGGGGAGRVDAAVIAESMDTMD